MSLDITRKGKTMIDEKKILKALRGYCDATYGTLRTDPFIAEAFRKGAQWAQEEFLKSLWHDASEEPRNTECLLELNVQWNEHHKVEKTFIVDWFGSLGFRGEELRNLQERYEKVSLSRWLYIDELLLKQKGGVK